MFLKPFRIKSHSQLKGSEKKKLSAEVAQNFPNLTKDELSAVVPSKADIVLAKVFCAKGEIVHIYQIQKEPLFFKVDKKEQIYPSVYFLWKFPSLIKTFTTHDQVVSKLQQGADLMLPGIVIGDEVQMNSYGKFERGHLVAVNTVSNACPFAVGATALSSLDMYMAAQKGKGVIILHTYRDHLWEMGSKSLIPEIPHFVENANNKGENLEVDVDSLALSLQEETFTQDKSEDSPEASGPEAMDELFYYCFLKALKSSVKATDLPILTSNFYCLHMATVCPSDKSLDVKKSSYKKLSKFLDAMVKKNLIEVKEYPKGVENITAINYVHEDMKQFVVDKSEKCPATEIKAETSSNTGFAPPVLEEVYQVSGTTIQFFRKNGYSKGDVLSRADVRAVVTAYIEKNKLKCDSKVEVDPLLHEAVVGPKEGYKEFLRWDEIFSRLLGKMSNAVMISRKGQVPLIKKGKLTPIEISVAKRSGNKKVTLVYNVGTFGIDEQEFAHQIQIGVATSTSVGPAEHKPVGTTVVLCQGNQVAFIGKLLLETYNIPRKYIRGLELAIKGRK